VTSRARLGALAVLCLVAVGCAHYPLNARLPEDSSADRGYRFPPVVIARPDPADELFVCLSFSGGGTRAAAFAYGALLRLREIDLGRGGTRRSLLDEVDCIAGISGGAFTAAYYGLFGVKTFERFYDRFLVRNIQGELALAAANPVSLVRLASPYFSRIDLAAELYDATVFEHATYAALAGRPRPFVILHATSMANGAPFEFTQDEFDFLGSDLGSFPVGRAAAASSAFPFLLSPVSLRSYPPAAGFAVPLDVRLGLETRELNPSRYVWARQRLDLMSGEDKKWVHLLDGGLADNIGLRSILRAYDRSAGFIAQRLNAGHIKRLVVIAVNARTDPPEKLSAQERSPGLSDVFMKTATVSMEALSGDTIDYAISRQTEREQAQTNIRVCNERLTGCSAEPFPTFAREVRTCFVEISFEGLPPKEREEMLGLPTTFALPEATVKRLIEVAGQLLDQSPGFQKLLKALRGEPAPGAGIGERGNCS
jgi:predicted acylesterase/phospholipase RssA